MIQTLLSSSRPRYSSQLKVIVRGLDGCIYLEFQQWSKLYNIAEPDMETTEIGGKDVGNE